ncbi:MAG: DUF6273 domain-containing protein [Lachnospiraceae bacterium]|nr:DUF6273 domain-containing protein [Lachnospiraceae bacterium]
MKRKKTIIIICICVVVLAAVGVAAVLLLNQKKGSDELSKPGHFIEVEVTPEPEIDYAELSEAKVGDKVQIGDYEGEISWTVLEEKGDKLFLITSGCVAENSYHDKDEETSWKDCTLRAWLNDTFYNEAFSDDEKKSILKTKVVNKKNPDFDTVGGKPTRDFVYLLSIDEANNYFDDRGVRMATNKEGNFVWWWLRSPGFQPNDAANVGDYGYVNTAGHKVFDKYVMNGGVRPVMWVKRK